MKAISNHLDIAPTIRLILREEWFRGLTSFEEQLHQQLAIIKNDLFSEYGITYPSVTISFNEDFLGGEIGKILFWDVEYKLDLPEEPDETTPGSLFAQVKKLLSTAKPYFITTNVVEGQLSKLSQGQPDLVKQATERIGLEGITLILRALTQEGIMIRDLVRILQAVIDADFITSNSRDFYITDARVAVKENAWTESPADILRFVRASLRDQISYKFAPSQQMPAVLVDNTMERFLNENYPDGISPEDSEKIMADIQTCFAEWDFDNYYPILFTDDSSRLALWELVQPVYPQMRVLAYSEISPYITIDRKGSLGAPR